MVIIEAKVKKGTSSVFAMSIVEYPATEENFLALAKEDEMVLKLGSEDKRIITGPALVPDKKIYRSAEQLKLASDGYIVFSEETVRDCAYTYLSAANNNNVTLQHSEKTDGLVMLESWVVEDSEKDKSAFLGMNYPVGTWMLSYRVNDDEIWEGVKSGKYNGFSLEGKFVNQIIETSLSEEDKPFTWEEYADAIRV